MFVKANSVYFSDYLMKGEKDKALLEFQKLTDKKHPLEILAAIQTMLRKWIIIKTKSSSLTSLELSKLTAKEREQTGIKNLKIDYNRVFGYYIEVTNSFKDKVPYYFQRKQTLANAERFITDELKELEVQLLSSAEKALQLEIEIYNKIKEHLGSLIIEFQQTADAIAGCCV